MCMTFIFIEQIICPSCLLLLSFLVALISSCLSQIMLDYFQNTEANWDVRIALSGRWQCIMKYGAGLYTKYSDRGEASDHVEYEASLIFMCLPPTHLHDNLHPQHACARGWWPISRMDRNTSTLYIRCIQNSWRLTNARKTHTNTSAGQRVPLVEKLAGFLPLGSNNPEAFLYHIAKDCIHRHKHTHAHTHTYTHTYTRSLPPFSSPIIHYSKPSQALQTMRSWMGESEANLWTCALLLFQ